MSHAIATQFISHDLPGFTAVVPYQSFEEAFCCSPIPLGLQIDINHFSVMVEY
jgi:hypothetical protein